MKTRIGIVIVFLLLTILPVASAATEVLLSQQTLGDFAPPYRLRTSVASNGRGYVVAWEATADVESDVTSIYVRVLGGDGAPTRPSPTLLGLGREPRAVWNGHEYLVVWGITSAARGPLPSPSVVGVRLREDGTQIDAAPVTLISESNPFSTMTTIEWNGSQYLVTWNRGMALVDADLQHFKIVGSVGGTPFYSASLGGSFVVLSSVYDANGFAFYIMPITASGELGSVTTLEKASRGNVVPFADSYVMIWDDETTLHYGVLNGQGRVVTASVIGPGHVGFPRLATRDGRLVGSWQSYVDDMHTSVCTVRFETMFQPVCSAISTGLQHDPAIGTASTSILAAWGDRTGSRDSVRVLRSPLSESPHIEAGLGRSVSDASSTPAPERRADGSLAVAWSEYNPSTKRNEIHLGGKSSQGARLADRAVFAGDVDQTSPVIAAGGGRTMALWEEGAAGSAAIRMTIVDDATKSIIATFPLGAGSAPSVAFDGKEWLAAWQSASGVIHFAVIDTNGLVIASGAMPAETAAQASPAVAWSGKTFLVTWRETVAAGERIEVATVNAVGVASASRTLDAAESGMAAPSIAANGSRLLVSWGTPSGTLRQMLLDDAGKQLSGFINFAWPYTVSRTRTRAMPNGYAVLAGSRIALTSADGRATNAFDVPDVAAGGDFAANSDGRFDVVYSRSTDTAIVATFVQTVGTPLGLPRKHATR
jgi:hypothetical protein